MNDADSKPDPGGWLTRLWSRFTAHMEPAVFLPAAGVVIAFVTFGAVASSMANRYFTTVREIVLSYFGWAYILGATAILGLVIVLLVGPFGAVRLGRDDDRPEFSRPAWLAMLFSAGMGTGLVFWGVAEPVHHLVEPPPVIDGPPVEGVMAQRRSLAIAFFHWGLHPWAIYTLFGLCIAYFHFRRGLPLAPRSMLYPVLGSRIYGWPGHAVDVFCTVGTLFGVATSLGFGAQQVNAGLALLTDVPASSVFVQLILIAVMTAIATTSVVLGLKAGLRRLSQFNLLLAAAVLVFVAVVGSTGYTADMLTSALSAYLVDLPERALFIRPDARPWQDDWTLFYWSWWMSWSPFVGIFVARISKGRTLRDFTVNVLLVPVIVTFVWLAVMGTAGMSFVAQEGLEGRFATSTIQDPATALHRLLERLPLAPVTMVVATVLIIVFFVSSSDSGSFVDDMVTAGGDPNPPRAQRVFWALAEGAVAATLLGAGGLRALRTASLQSGLPTLMILLAAGFSLYRALMRHESRRSGDSPQWGGSP